MTPRPILDAGPSLNFFSLHKERLLFATLGPLSAPETVKDEVLRKAARDQRFSAALDVWRKLPGHLLQILSDEYATDLASAIQRISGSRFQDRLQTSRDLGETMVTGHAVISAEAGHHVLVLMDDYAGCQMVTQEAARLRRLATSGKTVGSIQLIHTTTVLERAAGGQYIPNRNEMRALYDRLRSLDNALVPLDRTSLMQLPVWDA